MEATRSLPSISSDYMALIPDFIFLSNVSSATSIQPRQWHITAWLVHIGDGAGASPLLQQPHALPDEGGGAEVVVFGDSAA